MAIVHMSWQGALDAYLVIVGLFVYFLGFLAALIYYVTTAPSIWDAILGFFKAILWPAFLVYNLLEFLKM